MKFKTFYAGLFCVALVSGCAELPQKSQATINTALLEPQTALKFSDIPVPVGFKPIPQESYSFESGGVRVGLLKYQGKANVDQVVNFYKEQMVMFDWNLINSVEYGQRMLNFDREGETCIVNLVSKGSNVIITFSIGPKAQETGKKNQRIVK